MIKLPSGVEINKLIDDLKIISWEASEILLHYSKILKNKVDKIVLDYFSNAYDSLSKFGITNNSELYSFFKFIQERHY